MLTIGVAKCGRHSTSPSRDAAVRPLDHDVVMGDRFVLGLCGVTLLMNSGRRAGVVSNLGDVQNGAGTIYAPPEPQEYAQEFTTGSQSVELGTVIANSGAASGSFTASAELVADKSGLPGSTLLTSFLSRRSGQAYNLS